MPDRRLSSSTVLPFLIEASRMRRNRTSKNGFAITSLSRSDVTFKLPGGQIHTEQYEGVCPLPILRISPNAFRSACSKLLFTNPVDVEPDALARAHPATIIGTRQRHRRTVGKWAKSETDSQERFRPAAVITAWRNVPKRLGFVRLGTLIIRLNGSEIVAIPIAVTRTEVCSYRLYVPQVTP